MQPSPKYNVLLLPAVRLAAQVGLMVERQGEPPLKPPSAVSAAAPGPCEVTA
jgi:hypothetical protein